MKIQMCFPIWQGITLNTPGCTPTWDILCPPAPVSASIQPPDRYVRTKLRCPGPLVSFQSQDTAQRLLHHPRSHHTPCPVLGLLTWTRALDLSVKQPPCSLSHPIPGPRFSPSPGPTFPYQMGSCSSAIEILAQPHVYAC